MRLAARAHSILVCSCLAGLSLAGTAGAQQAAKGQELLYVGNNRGGTVSVIEVPGFKVIGEFNAIPDITAREPSASYVDDVVGSPSGEVLYVSRGAARDVAAFSTATERLLWRVPTHGVADHFALSPDGKHLFVSVESEGHAVVIATTSRRVVGKFDTGSGPHGMRMSHDGRRVYNGCITGDQVNVVDAKSFQVIRRIQFGEGVRPFDLTRDEKRMFLQLSKLHGFVELDLTSDRVTKTIHLPVPEGVTHQKAYPHTAHHGLALSPDEKHLCVGSTVADYAAILSMPTLDLLATIPVGQEPSWVVPSLDGRYFYVSARKGNTVSVLSIEERREKARIKVGDYPQRMWTMRVPERRVPTSP